MIHAIGRFTAGRRAGAVVQVDFAKARQDLFYHGKQIIRSGETSQYMPAIQTDRKVESLGHLQRQVEGKFDGFDGQFAGRQAGLLENFLNGLQGIRLKLAQNQRFAGGRQAHLVKLGCQRTGGVQHIALRLQGQGGADTVAQRPHRTQPHRL